MTDTQENWEGGQEVQSNWFKFEKVGDRIKGTLVAKHYQKSSDPKFADQWVYELKVADGKVFNVGISILKEGTVKRLNNCKIGEIIGILFEKEGEQTPEQIKKKMAPAKFLKIISFGMDEEFKGFEDAAKEEDELPAM